MKQQCINEFVEKVINSCVTDEQRDNAVAWSSGLYFKFPEHPSTLKSLAKITGDSVTSTDDQHNN